MALLRALLDVVLPVVLVAGLGALLARRFPLDRATITKIALNALYGVLEFTAPVDANLALPLVFLASAAGILLAALPKR